MSKLGGYAILDLQDTPLVASAANGVNIPGTYAALQGAVNARKAVLVSGLNMAAADADASTATPYPDSFGTVWQNAEDTLSVRFAANGQTAQVHITSGNEVTVELG